MRFEQLSLFTAASKTPEPVYVETHGPRLVWDELRPGMAVVYDCSTENATWLLAAAVEKIIRTPDDLRVILDGGHKQRPLINRCHIDAGRVKLYRR